MGRLPFDYAVQNGTRLPPPRRQDKLRDVPPRSLFQCRSGFGWVVFFFAALTAAVRAETGSPFSIAVWQVEDGLPDNTVTSIAQTPDGYLWLGTFGGLVRYDGLRFPVFETRTPGLESERVLRLFVDVEGGLWVSMQYGQLARYFGGRFTSFHKDDGWPMEPCRVRGLATDAEGAALLLPESGQVLRFDGKRFTRVWADSSTNGLVSLDQDMGRKNLLWASRGDTVGLLKGSEWIEFQSADGMRATVDAVAPSGAGGLWVFQAGRLHLLRSGMGIVATIRYPLSAGPYFMHEDSAGHLWTCTWGEGLLELARDGSYRRYSTGTGFP